LVRALERRGIAIHGIQSQRQRPEWAHDTFFLAEDRDLLVFDGDREALLEKVGQYRPDGILTGADGEGPMLADFLTENIGLLTNGTRQSLARRQKVAMQNGLADGKLRFIEGVLTGNLKEAVAFASRVGYPIYLKPNDGGGGQFNFIVESEGELEAKFNTIIEAENDTTFRKFGLALVEEYVDGTEYAVQGVVREGVLKLSSVIEYLKVPIEGFATTYQAEWTIRPDSLEAQMLMEYVKHANPALGMKNGAFHWEIKISKRKGGAVGIELNPRPIGSGWGELLAECVGYDDVDLAIEAAFFEPEFRKRPDVYELKKDGFRFALLTPRSGLRLQQKMLEIVSQMPGYVRARYFQDPKQTLPKTVNLDTTALFFEFMFDNRKTQDETLEKLLGWQKQEQELFFSP